MTQISEPDWKIFKTLREAALDRFSRQILEESVSICSDTDIPAHQRYLKLYDHIRTRDRELANAFDDFRRSTALMCLRLMRRMGLLTDAEISAFSHESRRVINLDL